MHALNTAAPALSAIARVWTIHSFPAEQHESGEASRFVIHAPLGLKVVAITAHPGDPMMVTVLAPIGARAAPHAFWFVGPDEVIEPFLGHSLGAVWPIVLINPHGAHAMMFAIEDRPWVTPERGDA